MRRDEEEVHQLGSWPHAPVGLVEVPEFGPQLLAALLQCLALQAAKAWEEDQKVNEAEVAARQKQSTRAGPGK